MVISYYDTDEDVRFEKEWDVILDPNEDTERYTLDEECLDDCL